MQTVTIITTIIGTASIGTASTADELIAREVQAMVKKITRLEDGCDEAIFMAACLASYQKTGKIECQPHNVWIFVRKSNMFKVEKVHDSFTLTGLTEFGKKVLAALGVTYDES